MSVTFNGIDLGKANSIRVEYLSGSISVPMPGQTSDKNIVYVLSGPTEKISINTTYTGTEAEIQSFNENYLRVWNNTPPSSPYYLSTPLHSVDFKAVLLHSSIDYVNEAVGYAKINYVFARCDGTNYITL